jgi:bacillithiol biosynthesis deacetylase BshB1
MKLDILAFGSHPDDVELTCSGTLALHASMGKSIGVIDLTQGELGTRGNVQIRKEEAYNSAKILNLQVRENLLMEDGFFEHSKSNILSVATCIRKYQPDIVLANSINDRHPDHGRAAKLVQESCFYSGLKKIELHDGATLAPWRPKAVYHYIQSYYIKPDFIVDISDFWDTKIKSIKAFKSQFYDPESKEPETFISKPGFLEFLESRDRMWGHIIGVEYGEGFTVNREIGVKNLMDLI